jgi:hypothetical protein
MNRKLLSVVLKVILVVGILILIFPLLWSFVCSTIGDKIWGELIDNQNEIPKNSLPVGVAVFKSHLSWSPIIYGISILLAIVLAIWGIKRL